MVTDVCERMAAVEDGGVIFMLGVREVRKPDEDASSPAVVAFRRFRGRRATDDFSLRVEFTFSAG